MNSKSYDQLKEMQYSFYSAFKGVVLFERVDELRFDGFRPLKHLVSFLPLLYLGFRSIVDISHNPC